MFLRDFCLPVHYHINRTVFQSEMERGTETVERGTETRSARATYYVLIKGAASGAGRAAAIITRFYRIFPNISGFYRIFPAPVKTRNNPERVSVPRFTASVPRFT